MRGLGCAGLTGLLTLLPAPVSAQRQMEALGRGVVAVNQGDGRVYVGWRLLGTDREEIAFNLYRTAGAGVPAVRLNAAPLAQTTDFLDTTASLTQTAEYFVRPVLNGAELPASTAFALPASAPVRPYLTIPLTPPPNGVTPLGVGYSYVPNDCSAADLDGDGEYEIILKWDPTNAQDNAFPGFTGHVFIDAYKLDGTRLWRIDLGRNIRAGAHYTQFLVYDLDGDGRAELACKTADGTIDGTGVAIGDAAADWRVSSAETVPTSDSTGSTTQPDGSRVQALLGRILAGPEYLTIFDGRTGRALATTNYIPGRGRSIDWGDDYGNRVDRFLAGVAYLDGSRPSLVMCRGYYTRTVLVAWDWRDGQLTQRWKFDTRTDTNPGVAAPGFSRWEEMGNHQLSVADVDEDGRDEIVYGAMVVDDDGRGLYTTGRGHGDAFHVSDMDPDRPGLEVYGPHESPRLYGDYGSEMRDARTGTPIWGASGQNSDVGRGVAFDIDPRYRGYEAWASRGGLYGARGELITNSRPSQMNFGVWWDADPLREILDGTTISKWDWNLSRTNTVLSATGAASNNGTKSTPALSADLFGDWREEVVLRSSDNRELRIYTTTIPATDRRYTLMHDPQYRLAIAWQNVAYNQPPHPGFYLGDGMAAAPVPKIRATPARIPFATSPAHSIAAAGGPVTLSATSATAAALQWQRNGADLPGATSGTLTLDALQPAATGLYAVHAAYGTAGGESSPAIVGLASPAKTLGAAREIAADLSHPLNGNIFDQVLLEGVATSVAADPGQVLRLSFLDLNDDIVQVEFSGAGTLSLTLEDMTGPARPLKYNQEVDYVRGHAGIVVTGADETTHLAVFSVGSATAVNQTLFREGTSYDGVADLAFIAIASANGKFGSLRTANTNYFAARGFAGVYAPGVEFTGPVYLSDIDALGTAKPLLILGAATDVRIAGGDLAQTNAQAVQISGVTRLQFTAGATSHGGYLAAQANRGRLEQNGVDVTAAVVAGP